VLIRPLGLELPLQLHIALTQLLHLHGHPLFELLNVLLVLLEHLVLAVGDLPQLVPAGECALLTGDCVQAHTAVA
jgi:hypothetical protein